MDSRLNLSNRSGRGPALPLQSSPSSSFETDAYLSARPSSRRVRRADLSDDDVNEALRDDDDLDDLFAFRPGARLLVGERGLAQLFLGGFGADVDAPAHLAVDL